MAKTLAERARKYRDSFREKGGIFVQVALPPEQTAVVNEFAKFAGLSTTAVVRDIITTWVCDTAESMSESKQLDKVRKEAKQCQHQR